MISGTNLIHNSIWEIRMWGIIIVKGDWYKDFFLIIFNCYVSQKWVPLPTIFNCKANNML